MGDILATRNLSTLANFAHSSVLLAFDYDGTLAPITARPARARMRTVTRRLLSQLAQRYPCVVISGREHADLASRLGGLPLSEVFGNFGFEPWAQTDEAARRVHEWAHHLRTRLATYPGLVIEDKTYSLTIHCRRVGDKAGVHRAIAVAVRALPDARVLGGDQAVNLILRGAPDKGITLQRARRVFACDAALYVGDDDTDEDAFASAPPGQLLAIRVGSARGTRARYHIKSQTDIDSLLRTLLRLRVRQSHPSDSRRRAS